jgi:hypothetical protein
LRIDLNSGVRQKMLRIRKAWQHPASVILNSFQDLSCPKEPKPVGEKWALKQVQGDDVCVRRGWHEAVASLRMSSDVASSKQFRQKFIVLETTSKAGSKN